MKSYNFILVLSGIYSPTDDFEEGLFEAGCDDGTLSFRNRVAYIEFDREAASFKDAVISAIKQVESVDEPVTVERVEPDDFVTASEIARRINRTHEYVRRLIEGGRGAGNFPVPLSGITTKSLMWSWVKIARWLLNHSMVDEEEFQIAQDVADINNALFYRNDVEAPKRFRIVNDLLAKLES